MAVEPDDDGCRRARRAWSFGVQDVEAAVASGDSMVRDPGVDPPWWDLREEPRYRALWAAIGPRPTDGARMTDRPRRAE